MISTGSSSSGIRISVRIPLAITVTIAVTITFAFSTCTTIINYLEPGVRSPLPENNNIIQSLCFWVTPHTNQPPTLLQKRTFLR